VARAGAGRAFSHQFVMGRDIEAALSRAAGKEERATAIPSTCSEAALTAADAQHYREKYSRPLRRLAVRSSHANRSRPGTASRSAVGAAPAL
jgi:hypothetical protein